LVLTKFTGGNAGLFHGLKYVFCASFSDYEIKMKA